jgi:hypothetical protein
MEFMLRCESAWKIHYRPRSWVGQLPHHSPSLETGFDQMNDHAYLVVETRKPLETAHLTTTANGSSLSPLSILSFPATLRFDLGKSDV